jgi:hypothetical protein
MTIFIDNFGSYCPYKVKALHKIGLSRIEGFFYTYRVVDKQLFMLSVVRYEINMKVLNMNG